MNQVKLPVKLLLVVTLLFSSFLLKAQHLDLQHKRVGLYLGSKSVGIGSDYYILINQFLTLEEDRSWEENQKVEFLIRLGQRWSLELQQLSGADTVVFLNGDMELGKLYQMNGAGEVLRSGRLDAVITLDSLSLATRIKRVNFIRSNKLLTSKLKIHNAQMHSSIYLPAREARHTQTCFDEDLHIFPPLLIDLYSEDSSLGKFCSGLFSQWWLEVYSGEDSKCIK